jgi:hypothetical protein
MPTILRIEGFRFFFYSDERQEPAHIHVRRGEDEAKFWLAPVPLSWNDGFNGATLSSLSLHKIVRENETLFLQSAKGADGRRHTAKK